MKCLHCVKKAEVVMTWPTSRGMEKCAFCRPCGAEAWEKIKTVPNSVSGFTMWSVEREGGA